VQRLDEAIKIQGQGGTPSMQLFLAMAQHRLPSTAHAASTVGLLATPWGKGVLLALRPYSTRAGDWLARAEKQLQTRKSANWEERVLTDYLLTEAQTLIRGAREPAKR
jgi:hypothetical protein